MSHSKANTEEPSGQQDGIFPVSRKLCCEGWGGAPFLLQRLPILALGPAPSALITHGQFIHPGLEYCIIIFQRSELSCPRQDIRQERARIQSDSKPVLFPPFL